MTAGVYQLTGAALTTGFTINWPLAEKFGEQASGPASACRPRPAGEHRGVTQTIVIQRRTELLLFSDKPWNERVVGKGHDNRSSSVSIIEV